MQFVRGDRATTDFSTGFDRPTLEWHFPDTGRGVCRERFGAEGFVVEQKLDLLAVAVNFDAFIVWFQIAWCPIGEMSLAAHEGIESRIAGRRAVGFNTATDENHRFV